MDLKTGSIKAKFKTGDQIKSSPQFYMNEVWCGSHDGILYCVSFRKDNVNEVFRWESGSPIFASPAIDPVHSRILACNLRGDIQCFTAEKKTLWQLSLSSPIFSSPTVDDQGNFYVASVNHYIYRFNGASGECVWKTQVNAPIFSSPTYHQGRIIIGSHGNGILILECFTGTIVESISSLHPVYASPCVSENGHIVWASTKGQVCWKNSAQSLELNGHVFSSPLFVNQKGHVLVGCRNNLLYYLTWIH
jgi:outer membrane protein assembly factor BamB